MESKFYVAVKNNLIKNVNFKTFLGFSISAVLLSFTFYKSGLQLKNLSLNRIEWFYFGSAVSIFILTTFIQSFRTKLLWLNETIKLKDIKTYDSLIIGNFYNCLLPGNLGEGVRAWHFSSKNKKPLSGSLAMVVTEKWIDAQIFAPVSLILLAIKPFISHYILYAIAYTSAIILTLMIVYGLMRHYKYVEKRIWLFVLSFRKSGRFLFKVYCHANRQLDNLKESGLWMYYFLLCAVFFFLNILQFLLLMKVAGIAEPVAGLYSSFLIAMSIMIIAIIPSAPSNIGVMHYGIYATLILAANQYGLSSDGPSLKSYALFAIYLHLSYVIPEVVLGIIFVVKERRLMFR